MARILKLGKAIVDYNANQSVHEISSVVQKAMRAKILLDREIRGFTKADIKGPPGSYETHPERNAYCRVPKDHHLVLDNKGQSLIKTDGYTFEQAGQRQLENETKDVITIVDIDHNAEDPHAKVRLASLQLQHRPPTIQMNAESQISAVPTLGRNNPFYHYSGSEDILTFDISWYATTKSRRDVLYKCRWLESLTKADGYNTAPHRVKIVWGEDNLMFNDQVWILVSAPYVLTNFIDKGYNKSPGSSEWGKTEKLGLVPTMATQQLTFKKLRVYNATYSDIMEMGNIDYLL